jgi:hypothetical protein
MSEYRNHTIGTTTTEYALSSGKLTTITGPCGTWNLYTDDAKKIHASIDLAIADAEVRPLCLKLVHNADGNGLASTGELPEVGRARYVYAMGQLRQGVVVKVAKARTTVAYTTASSDGRIYRKAVVHSETFVPRIQDAGVAHQEALAAEKAVEATAAPVVAETTPAAQEDVASGLEITPCEPGTGPAPEVPVDYPNPFVLATIVGLVQLDRPMFIGSHVRADLELDDRSDWLTKIPGIDLWVASDVAKEFVREHVLSDFPK